MTAEAIVEQYPVLRLADVYAVIAYYLHHIDEVTSYLEDRDDCRKPFVKKANGISIQPECVAATSLCAKTAIDRSMLVTHLEEIELISW